MYRCLSCILALFVAFILAGPALAVDAGYYFNMAGELIDLPNPGTEFYDYVKQNNLITMDSMTDEAGHQLPNLVYPGLDRGELMEWIERFYDEYYFRPRVVWRVVRNAIFDSGERRRLHKAAKEYLALRGKRRRFVKAQKREAGSQATAEDRAG